MTSLHHTNVKLKNIDNDKYVQEKRMSNVIEVSNFLYKFFLNDMVYEVSTSHHSQHNLMIYKMLTLHAPHHLGQNLGIKKSRYPALLIFKTNNYDIS